MKKIIYILLSVVFLSSCLRLDDFLYAPFQVEEYQLNNLDPEFLVIDSELFIEEDKIHLFDLESENEEGGKETIYAVYLGDTNRIQTDTVFVYCHGNAYQLDAYWQRATLLANVGGAKNRYGVLIMDYQGYGKSTGKPYENGLYKDVNACVEWLKEKGLTGDRLVMYGFSMGTAPATELTANPRALRPSKVVLEAPFASAEMLVHDATPLSLPGSFFTNLKIDNAEEIKKIDQPFLWFHGEKDDFLTREFHGQVVFDNYKGSFKDKLISPEAGHADFPEVVGVDKYLIKMAEFLVK